MDAQAPTGFTVIANGAAGGAERAAIRTAAGRLAESAPVRLLWTSSREEIQAAIDASPPNWSPVAAGGDGTVHTLVDVLHAGGELLRPVGLIPAGTANDLARNSGLPLDPLEAADRICEGHRRRLPLVAGPRGVVLNNAHVGVGVAGARRAERWKPSLGAAAYPFATIAEALTFESIEFDLAVDEDHFHAGPATAFVALAAGPGMGGGHAVIPAEDFDDSATQVTVMVFEAAGVARRLEALATKLAGGDPDGVIVRSGQRLSWRTDSELEADVDGELQSWPAEGALNVAGAWTLLGAAAP